MTIIVGPNERHQGRKLTINAGEKTGVRQWLCKSDNVEDADAEAVLAVADLIAGVAYRGMYPSSLSADAYDNSKEWQLVTVNYSDKVDAEAIGGDPTLVVDTVSWSGDESEEPYFFDTQDPPAPATNTAGEPFEALPTRRAGTITAIITRNVSTYSVANGYNYAYTVNAGSFTLDGATIPAEYALLGVIQASEPLITNGTSYRQLSIPIYIKAPSGEIEDEKPWRHYFANEGFEELAGDGKRKPITNSDGVKIKRPWPLNEDGTKKTNADDDVDHIELQPYRVAAWQSVLFS